MKSLLLGNFTTKSLNFITGALYLKSRSTAKPCSSRNSIAGRRPEGQAIMTGRGFGHWSHLP